MGRENLEFVAFHSKKGATALIPSSLPSSDFCERGLSYIFMFIFIFIKKQPSQLIDKVLV